MNVKEFIEEKKVLAIVRGTYGEDLRKLSHALYQGGVRLMEVTFDQGDPDCVRKTTGAISMLRKDFGGELLAGAGTVLSAAQAEEAFQAGAEFILSPNTDPEVIRKTKELGMVSIPGAMTSTEIVRAYQCGADFVKIFPAGTLGIRYLKDILAPLNFIRLIATAGITEENFAEFLDVGCAGAGISGRLTDKQMIAEGAWDEFTRRAEKFTAIAEKHGKLHA